MSAPAQPLVVTTLEGLLAWAPFHEGQVQAYWREQWKFNARSEVDMERLTIRVRALERRGWMIAGAASFAGASVPILLFLASGQ